MTQFEIHNPEPTILVTGGCGLIGSTIVDQLLDQLPKCRVRIIDNLSRGTLFNLERALTSGRVTLIRDDIRHFDRIRPHFDGVDAVFHQAAIRITRCSKSPVNALRSWSMGLSTCFSPA